MSSISNEPMLEMFLFETSQLLEQLEHDLLLGEKSKMLDMTAINEIFRIMHTVKGSSAMMQYHHISKTSHSLEDLFFCLREDKPRNVNYTELTDLVLRVSDFIKQELEKIEEGIEADGDPKDIIDLIDTVLDKIKHQNNIEENKEEIKKEMILNCSNSQELKIPQMIDLSYDESKIELDITILKQDPTLNYFRTTIYFEEDCLMENMRAFTVLNEIEDIIVEKHCIPIDLMDDDNSNDIIREDGFKIIFSTSLSYECVHQVLVQTPLLNKLILEQLEPITTNICNCIKEEDTQSNLSNRLTTNLEEKHLKNKSLQQNMISVNVKKLDFLLDLVGEMVISEEMVIQNPDLKGLKLDNFYKSARQLQKITNELRDIVMSIRMVPLSTTFQKMHRIVRDMSKKLDKEVTLELIGEETEVDKNIIEKISDPLMHLVRNSIDHGIESEEERKNCGKSKVGTIRLEAKNIGSDVLIHIQDDGKGLSKQSILKKAEKNGLLNKPVKDMSDKEIYNLIFLPGFSTKENITEFSGRGVGMDVVSKNIESIGGSVFVESVEGKGSTVTLKLPLTLAIIDGMNIQVGTSKYTIPITAIKESFRPNKNDLIIDPDKNEMIMVRGQCYPIIRLHRIFKVHTEITDFENGIFIMVEQGEKSMCLFADELLGQQQVVVKSLPNYIKNFRKINGLGGCTLLGDGSISLIIDIGNLNID